MKFSRIYAIFRAELRAAFRERLPPPLIVLLFSVVFIGVGASGPILQRQRMDYLEAQKEEDLPKPTWDCQPGEMVAVAVAGVVPDWLEWPDPFVEAENADVLLRFFPEKNGEPQDVELVELHEKANSDPVRACLFARSAVERRRRMSLLGFSEDSKNLVETVLLPPGLPGETRRQLPSGLSVLTGAMFLLLSVFIDFGPRARASGWLETFLVLPGSRADLVVSWWGLGSLVTGAGLNLVCIGDRLGCAWAQVDTVPIPYLLIPILVVAISAVGVRVFVDVPDIRTALVQSVPALLLLMMLAGLAQLLELQYPGLGGLMPFGGLFLSMVGVGHGIWLPAFTTLLATELLLLDTVRALDHLAVRDGSMGRAAARHARGDYLLEALLLVLIAAAGMGSWLPPTIFASDPVSRNTIAMLMFMLAPSLLVSTALRLDRKTLISWQAPPLQSWLVVAVLVPATVCLSSHLLALSEMLLPTGVFKKLLEDTLGDFTGAWGLLAVSVAPGFCEELVFRGAVLGLLRKKLPDWAAILLQALGFALLHGLAFRLPHTFVLGVLFGVLTVRSGSVWPSIVVHTLHNLTASLLPPEQLAGWMDSWASWLVAGGVVSIWAVKRR